jgi:hypothetical protein
MEKRKTRAMPGSLSIFNEDFWNGNQRLMLVVVPVVGVMILMRPIPVVDMPAVRIMVIVGVRPISACIGWTPPFSAMPYPSSALRNPVAINPDVARTRHGWRRLIAQRWRRRTDGYAKRDLPESREGKSRS